MDYIEICEWDQFQHYKKRNPPWIKLYARMLDDDNFDCLPDDSKLLYFCLLPFASRCNNKIRFDLRWLQKKLPIHKAITRKTVNSLVDANFIDCYQDDSKVIANDKPDATPETEKSRDRVETENNTVFPDNLNTPEFIKKWKDWVQYRKDIKKKMIISTMDGQLKKLGKFSAEEAIATIEYSVAGGYTGLFPDRVSTTDPDRPKFDPIKQKAYEDKLMRRNP